jgi:TRAP-type mannitol/chloroaromatic compound transport system substrate-binding protein
MGKAKFANYSMDVLFEGGNVARLGDPMTMNGNGPNTLTAAEMQANLAAAIGDQLKDELCAAFNYCNGPAGAAGAAAAGGFDAGAALAGK